MFWRRKKDSPTEPEPSPQSQTMAPVEETPDITTGEASEDAQPPKKRGMFAKLFDRLRSTRDVIVKRTVQIFRLRGKIDDELLDELEEVLLSADVGLDATMGLMDELRRRIRKERKSGSDDIAWLTRTLREIALEMLDQGDRGLRTAETGPSIYLVIGVNGVGKTTAIGKLAHRLRNEGKKVLIVAADTFRAAAIQQLEIWAKRAEVPIEMGKEKSDPSSVVFNAMKRARDEQPDAVIIDTAGRLHTKVNLMQELSKMARVISREFTGAPHETLLVLDASTGQNAMQQAKLFMEACPISGLVLTKLDGTAKGGVVISLHKELGLPVKFIGVGESIEDLEPFHPQAFTRALFQMEGDEESEDELEAKEEVDEAAIAKE
jgi:fused signal recognition particle receptor